MEKHEVIRWCYLSITMYCYTFSHRWKCGELTWSYACWSIADVVFFSPAEIDVNTTRGEILHGTTKGSHPSKAKLGFPSTAFRRTNGEIDKTISSMSIAIVSNSVKVTWRNFHYDMWSHVDLNVHIKKTHTIAYPEVSIQSHGSQSGNRSVISP